jgi:hypothetical protein
MMHGKNVEHDVLRLAVAEEHGPPAAKRPKLLPMLG